MKTTQYWYCAEFEEKYGTVQRARGCYLYTRSGRRVVDMYQEAGRAILGWGNSMATTVFKNIMSRGLTGTFSTDYGHQLKRAVKALLPEYDQVRWFNSLFSTQTALAQYFDFWTEIPLGEHPLLDTSESPFTENYDLTLDSWLAKKGVPRWRPWLDEAWFSSWQEIPQHVMEINEKAQTAIVVVPPLPWVKSYYLVAFTEMEGRYIPPSDVLLPPVMASTARAIYDLIAEMPNRSEKDWCKFDFVIKKYWDRRGPYLLPKVPQSRYREFFDHCLDCGIVISPNYRVPSIIPWGAHEGDFSQLKKNPFTFEF